MKKMMCVSIRSRDKSDALRIALTDILEEIQSMDDPAILQGLLEMFDSTGELSTKNIQSEWLCDLFDTLVWLYEQGRLHEREIK